MQMGRGSTWLGAMMGFISWELAELLELSGEMFRWEDVVLLA